MLLNDVCPLCGAKLNLSAAEIRDILANRRATGRRDEDYILICDRCAEERPDLFAIGPAVGGLDPTHPPA